MQTVQLPQGLAPAPSTGLIRLGCDRDGGYLVVASDVFAAECIVGLGLGSDWSFEEDFMRLNDCPLVVYDASVGFMTFFWCAVLAPLGRGWRQKVARRWALLTWYRRFFRGNQIHRRQFVSAKPMPRTVPFSAVADWVGSRRIFLKVDIEGAEYGILDGIVALSPQLTGLAIEFHSCHRRMEEVCRLVERIGLTLVHVHVNNHAKGLHEGVPKVLELTFSSSTPAGGVAPALPHPLDRPNIKALPEIAIHFGP